MTRQTRREFAAAVTALGVSSVLSTNVEGLQASPSAIHPPDQRFFDALQKLMEVTAVPGIAIGVVQGDKPLWQRFVGVMDSSTKAPLTAR